MIQPEINGERLADIFFSIYTVYIYILILFSHSHLIIWIISSRSTLVLLDFCWLVLEPWQLSSHDFLSSSKDVWQMFHFLEKTNQVLLSCHEHWHCSSVGIWNPVWSLRCVLQMSESCWVSGAGGDAVRLLEHSVLD